MRWNVSGSAVVMLVATIAAGPKLAQVSAHALSSSDLAGAFDAAFLFCMVLEIIGIVLMLAVAGKEPSGESSGDRVLTGSRTNQQQNYRCGKQVLGNAGPGYGNAKRGE